MIPNFDQNAQSAIMGALGSLAITPSDTVFGSGVKLRAVTINGPGILAWKDIYGVAQITSTLPVGTYPLMATAIMVTGTTATGITGWF